MANSQNLTPILKEITQICNFIDYKGVNVEFARLIRCFYLPLQPMTNALITSMPVYVCGILSALLGLDLIRKWDKPKFWLLVFMAVATLLYICNSLLYNRVEKGISLYDTLYCFCNPAVYPLYYIYIQELTQRTVSFSRRLLYLLPALVCLAIVGTIYTVMSDDEIGTFLHHYLYEIDYHGLTGMAWWQGMAHLTVKIVFALQLPLVVACGWRDINAYNSIIEDNLADTEGKTLISFKSILVLLVISAVISFVCNLVGRDQFYASSWLIAFPTVTFSVLILLSGHIGLHQDYHFRFLEEEILEEEKEIVELMEEARGAESMMQSSMLKERIQKLMDEQKLFLRHNLKIGDLAVELNTNRNYIYNAINVEMGISFSEYVNRKRVEYAAKLMETEPGLNQSDIALKSGFASDSAFYRNFKAIYRCTPGEYQQRKREA